MSDYAKKLIKKICLIFCVSFGGMFALLYLFMSIRGRGTDYDSVINSGTEETTKQEQDGDSEEQESDERQLADTWGLRISSKEKMDFHRVLLEDDYRLFEGHEVDSNLDEKFSFVYPKNLYHSVEAKADDDEGNYSISFWGKDNSALLFYGQEKLEESDRDTLLDERYEEDKDVLAETEILLHLDTVYVVTGIDEESNLEIYKVVKTDEKNVYTMIIKTPVPEKEDARTLLSYYTEYLYRSCGFSGSTKKPRSYAQFLTGDE